MRHFLLALLVVCAAIGSEPQDPNNVHGKEDQGVGNDGHDQGVSQPIAVPTKVTVLPVDQIPAAGRKASFTNWDGVTAGSLGYSGIDGWSLTEAGNVKHATERTPYVQPWSRLDLTPPSAARAIVLTNGWPRDDKTVRMAGTVTINEGTPITISEWKADTALIIPVPAGVLVKSVIYKATTIPGADASGVHHIWLWQ